MVFIHGQEVHDHPMNIRRCFLCGTPGWKEDPDSKLCLTMPTDCLRQEHSTWQLMYGQRRTEKTGAFGAFQSVYAFILQFLEIAPHRCFYEIIREDRPCKAYFDLEAAPGAMTKEEGATMCDAVVRAWAARIRCAKE
jgi:hypothetical protein